MIVTILQRQQNSIATPGLTQDSLELYFNHPYARPASEHSGVGRTFATRLCGGLRLTQPSIRGSSGFHRPAVAARLPLTPVTHT